MRMSENFGFKNEQLIQEKIEDLLYLGVRSIKFYHYKTDMTQNMFTVCLLLDNENRIISRGVSICSLLDAFEKKKGRLISFGRAFGSAQGEETSREISFKPGNKRYLDYVQRIKRFGDVEESKNFVRHLSEYGIDHTSWCVNENGRGEETLVRYHIPYTWNIHKASCFFKYKSEFKPVPTGHEVFRFECTSWT